MSNLEDHEAEQDRITAEWEASHRALDEAIKAWNGTKSTATAHAFLATAMDYESEGTISTEELLDAVAEVRDWLGSKPNPTQSDAKPALKSYEIDLAVTVSVYGTVTVQAESLAAALEQVRADAAKASSGNVSIWDEVNAHGIDWSTEDDYRVLGARNVADVSDAATGVDLVTDSFDVISADHLTMQLEEKAWNDTIAPMTLEQRLDQTPDPDAEAVAKWVMFGK
jgi:hypothetical protein